MKHFILFFLLLSTCEIFATEKNEFELPPQKVTIFSKSAQVESETEVVLQPGLTVLKFIKLSPFIRKESIRVEGDGYFKIINVQHQNDFINELERNKEMEDLQFKIDELLAKTENEETLIKIINDKYDFLKSNREIAGSDQGITPEAFSSMIEIYGRNMEILMLEKLKKERLVIDYKKQMDKLNNQLNLLSTSREMPSGTIVVSAETIKALTTRIRISYVVDNVSWVPAYDLRYNGAGKPVMLTCKANIVQNSGVDWKNVKVVLSTAKTNISASIPDFRPWYLKFNYPEVESYLQGRAAGINVTESAGSPGAESRVMIRGVSGIPDNNPMYIVDGVPRKDLSNLNPDEIKSIDVVKDASATAIYGSRASDGVVNITTQKGRTNFNSPMTITWKQETSNEYEIGSKQNLPAGNQSTTIQYKETDLKAHFAYQSVPSLSANVFLIARVPEWYKAGVTSGEATIYLENSYVGKTWLSEQQFTDTMDISFGVDNHIDIKREKVYGFSASQIIGQNRKETRAYKITVRNNKTYTVSATITDQVPVSITKEIEVEILDASGGHVEKDSGRVEWKLEMKPNETIELLLKYEVKYPKNQVVTL